jgi:hypothetical protein
MKTKDFYIMYAYFTEFKNILGLERLRYIYMTTRYTVEPE